MTHVATKRSRSTAKSRRSASHKQSLPRVFLGLVALSWPGRVLLAALGVALVLGLNLLLAGRHVDRFFLITGIELIAAAVVGWLRLAIRRD